MTTKLKFLLSACMLLQSVYICSAQKNKAAEFTANIPPYLQDLQNGLPLQQLLAEDPDLYNCLMQRRAVSLGLLYKDVREGRLPQSSLNWAGVQQPQTNGVYNSNKKVNAEAAFDIGLVKDINTDANSNPSNYSNNFTASFAVLNNIIYYCADDGIHGNELWKSDGTAAGTSMVKDIDPGSGSSTPNYITVFKNNIYFSAYTQSTGSELYQSDGTAAGTKLLKDIYAGTTSSLPYRFTAVDNNLFFIANDGGGSYNSQLWKTNGTPDGTQLVQDLYTEFSANNLAQLTAANHLLFFTAYSYAYGREVYRSDGTSAGTTMIKNINNYNDNGRTNADGYSPFNLTAFNNELYFSADAGYRSIWHSDGTYAGTQVIENNNGILLSPGTYDYVSNDQPFAIANNTLYFKGYTYSTGSELCKYNISTGTAMVKDITPGFSNSGFTTEGIRVLNNKIYFSITDSLNNTALWISDGTSAGTDTIKKLPGKVSDFNFYSAGNALYFSTTDITSGTEPWVSDGTATGTKLLKDINTGIYSSKPTTFTKAGNKVFFAAYSANKGREMWRTNSTTGGAALVKDINTSATDNGTTYGSFLYDQCLPLNNDKVVFTAFTPESGFELWSSTGAAGTKLVKDIAPGESSGYPAFYASKKGKAYFIANDTPSTPQKIYVTDGTKAGTKKISSLGSYLYSLVVADNGTVFYTAFNPQTQQLELRRTDNSGQDYVLASPVYSPIAVNNNTCYFSAFSSTAGYELWKSNGTVNSTKVVADLVPGSGSSNPGDFKAINSNTVFTAYNASLQQVLWSTDGTAAGTSIISDIKPDNLSRGAVSGNNLYFSAYNSAIGSELYKTNGTAAGTKLVKDIYAGSSAPSSFTAIDSTVYFTAYDDVNGVELWKTTGTAGSTKLVKNITAGNAGSSLTYMTAAGGQLYFVNNNQLWYSEGTAATTQPVTDADLADVEAIGYLTGTATKLFMSAYTHSYGMELYEGEPANNLTADAIKVNRLLETSFSVKILTNPFISDLVLNITSSKNQQLQITVNDVNGKKLISKIISPDAYGNVSFKGQQWARGAYVITVSNGLKTIKLKALR